MERDNPKPRKRFSSDSSDLSANASSSRAGFMASLLGRRSLSLSIDDDHPIDLLGNENGNELKQEVEGIRNRTRTLSLGAENVDGDTASDETNPDKEKRQSRTLSISSLIFGDNNRNQKPSEINNDVFASSTTENSSFQETSIPEREISQTDHLNKRLLSSLLTRMNSFATNFIDPNGTGETVGQVYTDDVMMDRILRRVDSSSSPTSNSGSNNISE